VTDLFDGHNRPAVNTLCIGVAGGTGSGKTTVANEIVRRVGRERIVTINQDRYYHDLAHLDEAQRIHHNFDHPDAIEESLLVETLELLKAGKPAELPVYDFSSHVRTAQIERAEARPVILLEGRHRRRPALHPPSESGYCGTRAGGRERGRAVAGHRATDAPRVRGAVEALGRRHHPRRRIQHRRPRPRDQQDPADASNLELRIVRRAGWPCILTGLARTSHRLSWRGRRGAVPSGVFDLRGAESYLTVRRAPRSEKTPLGMVHRRPQQKAGEKCGLA